MCFKCDEPFTYWHKCKNKSHMLNECEDEGRFIKEEEDILLEPKERSQKSLCMP